ncbi:MAG: hypothetical protein IPG02_19600 [Ignavibacteria bacterium]|nr:hypothetical protein [Ignavibacteria bacterium]
MLITKRIVNIGYILSRMFMNLKQIAKRIAVVTERIKMSVIRIFFLLESSANSMPQQKCANIHRKLMQDRIEKVPISKDWKWISKIGMVRN